MYKVKLLFIGLFLFSFLSCSGPFWYGLRSLKEETGNINIAFDDPMLEAYAEWLQYQEYLESYEYGVGIGFYIWLEKYDF